MKKALLLALIVPVASFASCQGGEGAGATKASLIAALEINVGKQFQCRFQAYSTEVRDGFRISSHENGEHLFLESKTSCTYFVVEPSEFEPEFVFFESLENEVQHSTHYFPDEWKCNKFRVQGSIGFPNLFPSKRGGGLCSQAIDLLKEMSGGDVQVKGVRALISWSNNSQISEEDWERVELEVDLEQGVPVSFVKSYQDGRSMEFAFEDFDFFSGGYLEKKASLAANLSLPADFTCKCVADELVERLPGVLR